MIQHLAHSKALVISFLFAVIFSSNVSAQVIRTDSVNLVSVTATKVTKVVSKSSDTHLALAWQTYNADTTRLYYRIYSAKGTPLSKPFCVARVLNKSGFTTMDFDVTMHSNGEAVVAWSEFVSANKYNLKFCMFDVDGKAKDSPQNLGTGVMPFIKVSMNSLGAFLIAWNDTLANGGVFIQMFTAQGASEAAARRFWIDRMTASGNVLEYTDERHIHAGIMYNNSGPVCVVLRYDHLGNKLNSATTESSPLFPTDVSYGPNKSVFSFTNGSGTYFKMASAVSAGTSGNTILADNIAATSSQLAQNKNGSVGMAWTTATEVRMNIFESSGYTSHAYSIVPVAGLKPDWIDVMPNAESEVTVVVAANNAIGGQITLQRFRSQAPTESEELVVNNVAIGRGKVHASLSSANSHVALWQSKDATRSAIFAQVYDARFQKAGDPINVTGYLTHGELYDSYYFDFQAAIDSSGNFMVVWRTDAKDIYAVQFNPDGSIKLPKFKVNSTVSDIRMSQRIAASPNGKFVIFWRDAGGKVRARRFDNGTDSGDKVLKEYVWYGDFDAELRGQNCLAINNRGEFVCTFRTDYYGVQMLIYDELFQEIAAPFHPNLMYSDSKMSLVMNDNQMVMSWAMSGNKVGQMVQRFTTRGVKIGSEIAADTYVDYLRYPSLAINEKNEFMLAYQDDTQQLQQFSADGTMVGQRRRFTTLGEIPEVRVSQNEKGNVFAVYESRGYASPGTTTVGYNVVAKGLFKKSTAPKVYYVTRTINEGENFDFGNDKLTHAGRYSHLYGTDSLVVLTLHVTDQFAPATPAGIAAISGDKFVRLSWIANQEPDLKHYAVYRNTLDNPATAQQIATVSLQYTYQDNDASLIYGQRYYYWLAAVDKYNHTSAFTTSVNGVPVNNPPAQPVWDRIDRGDKFLDLVWKPNLENDIKHYLVYRNTTNNTATSQLITTTSATTYHDTQVNYSFTYYYWVVAVDTNDGISVRSLVKSSIPLNTPPAIPTDVVLTRVGNTITMTWKSNTEPDFLDYRVYRIPSATTPWYQDGTLLGQPKTNTITFEAIPGVISYYRVKAIDQGFTESEYSVVVSDEIKQDQTITFNPLPSRKLDDGSFMLNATASSGLPVSYSSSNPSIATINGNVVTLLAKGTVDITASQPGNVAYKAATEVQQTLVITNAQTITFEAVQTPLNVGATITLEATASSGLPVAYSLSNNTVAEINGGALTLIGPGSVDIIATQAGNGQYDPADPVTQTLVVKNAQTITFEPIPQPFAINESLTLQATATSGLPVSYSTSDPTVATVHDNVVTAISEGVVTITATQSGSDSFWAAESAQVINVTAILANESPGTERRVTLYPNPAKDQITLQLTGFSMQAPVEVKVSDIRGVMVHQATVSGHEAAINIADFVQGLYVIELKQEKVQVARKFVKQ